MKPALRNTTESRDRRLAILPDRNNSLGDDIAFDQFNRISKQQISHLIHFPGNEESLASSRRAVTMQRFGTAIMSVFGDAFLVIRLDHVRLKQEHNVLPTLTLRFLKVPLRLPRGIYLTTSISRPARKDTKQRSIYANYKMIS